MALIESIVAGKPVQGLHGSGEQTPGRLADSVNLSQQNELEHSAPTEAQKVITADGNGKGNATARPSTGTERGEDES